MVVAHQYSTCCAVRTADIQCMRDFLWIVRGCDVAMSVAAYSRALSCTAVSLVCTAGSVVTEQDSSCCAGFVLLSGTNQYVVFFFFNQNRVMCGL